MSESCYSLDNLCILNITGIDSEQFLQGQLTNDINKIKDNWQFSGYCNPKGRLIALFQIWREDNQIKLMLPAEQLDAVKKRLTMYVMRSKVSISLEAEQSIYGLTSLETIQALNPELIDAADSNGVQNYCIHANNDTLLKHPNGYVFISDKNIDCSTSIENWNNSTIQNGLPSINNQTTEMFVPQMVNLDLLEGINFQKGCYTGQEIVARMHYLGKVKQRLFVVESDSPFNDSSQIGEAIYCNEKSVGNLLNVSNNSTLALAVVKTEFVSEKLSLNNGTSLNIDLKKQPIEISLQAKA